MQTHWYVIEVTVKRCFLLSIFLGGCLSVSVCYFFPINLINGSRQILNSRAMPDVSYFFPIIITHHLVKTPTSNATPLLPLSLPIVTCLCSNFWDSEAVATGYPVVAVLEISGRPLAEACLILFTVQRKIWMLKQTCVCVCFYIFTLVFLRSCNLSISIPIIVIYHAH